MKAIKIILMAGGIIVAILFVDQFNQTSKKNIQLALEQTVNEKIMLCYINEGRYPPSLEYLEMNYALAYDKSDYAIFLIPIGENIKPDVTVFAYE
ncbi:MAG: hypothetical protein PHX61_12430 [Alphaproteobacteria bacterium]|nr:hypothetical protein [Alphaproteobacteria bacterium]